MAIKKNIIRFICVLLLAAAPLNIAAQDNGLAPSRSAGQDESLRSKIDTQQEQIGQLLRRLQHQSELIEQQSVALAELQKKVEASGKPVLSPAALVQATPAATAATASSTAPKVITAPKPVQNVETGFGKIKFNGLVQGWYAAGNQSFRDTFRIRRTELKFIGEITPRARWTVMIDPSKGLSMNNTYSSIDGTRVVTETGVNQASRMLQDAFITYDFSKHLRVNAGQFKVPLSLEGLQSSAGLETVERALFASDRARGGNLGDIRDLGVMIHGPLNSAIDYQLALLNGSGENQNDVDRNDQKAVAGRIVVRPPFIRGLQIGGSGAWGNGSGPDRPRRDRMGGELLFKRDAWMVKAELMTGKDGALSRLGYYTHLGYRLTPKLEAIFRFDRWDPDTHFETNVANVTERDFVTGVNYYITENNVKLQFNYLRKAFTDGLAPSRNVILVNLQTSW